MSLRWEEKSADGNGILDGRHFDGFTTDAGDARGQDVWVAELRLTDDGWFFGERVLGPPTQFGQSIIDHLMYPRAVTLEQAIAIVQGYRDKMIAATQTVYEAKKLWAKRSARDARQLRQELSLV